MSCTNFIASWARLRACRPRRWSRKLCASSNERESGGAKAAEKQTLDQFERWLKADEVPVDELAKELIVAAVFAGAADLAYGRPAEKKEVVTP